MTAAVKPSFCSECGAGRANPTAGCAECGDVFGGDGWIERLGRAGLDPSRIWLFESGISSRSSMVFAQAGCHVVSDVLALDMARTLRISGLGQVSLRAFHDALDLLVVKADVLVTECAERAGTCVDPEAPVFGAGFLPALRAVGRDPFGLSINLLALHSATRTLFQRAHLMTVGDVASLTNVAFVRILKWPSPELLGAIWATGAALLKTLNAECAQDQVRVAANPSDAVHERAVPVEPALAALAALVAMVDALPERAYDVVTMRQGFDDAGAMTLEEVGAHLGVTRERIRQIERKELDRLRRRRLLFEPALASVDVWRNTLGLSWRDRRLPPIMATVAPGTLWTDNGLVRFLLRLFEDRLQPADGIEDVEMAVVAILTGKDSLSAEELDAEVRLYLAPDDLARFPDFAVASRMDLLGPAVRRADGRFQLPPTAIEGLSDKRIRRLQAMRRVLEQRGPSHYSVIAEDLRALLPADYRMSERDVHSWLGRYDRIFVWAGTGVYGLMSQNVGIRADHQPSSSEPSTTTGRSRRRGCGQEIEQLLRECGPLPLAEIEDHVLARFQIRRSSVHAALTQGGIKRFVVGPDHIVSLRPDDEGEPSQDVRPEP